MVERRQLNIRLNDVTEQQLDDLREMGYSATSAVVVAIDRLWHDECQKGETTMEDNLYRVVEKITVEYSPASVFGSANPADEGWDEEASLVQYGESLVNHLYDEYPDAELDVRRSINDRVMINGLSDHDEIPFIEDIIDKVWNGDSWIVPLQDAD